MATTADRGSSSGLLKILIVVVLAAAVFIGLRVMGGSPTVPTGDAAGVARPREVDFGPGALGPGGELRRPPKQEAPASSDQQSWGN